MFFTKFGVESHILNIKLHTECKTKHLGFVILCILCFIILDKSSLENPFHRNEKSFTGMLEEDAGCNYCYVGVSDAS